MAKWILKVESVCNDPAKEKEFNDWYEKKHIPNVMETPGFVRTTRYVNNDPKTTEGKFVAIYEIESDDIDATMATHNANVAAKRKAGRMMEGFTVKSRGIYKQTFASK